MFLSLKILKGKKNILKLIFTFYLIITSIVFLLLVKYAPPLRYDAYEYNQLSDGLIKNKLNVIAFDFGKRTFVYPLFLSVIKNISSIFHLDSKIAVFFTQFLLFHLTNFLIFSVLKKHTKRPIPEIFMLISSLNIISLSYTTVFLTETLTVFITTLIFYFVMKKMTNRNIFITGILCGLLTYIRPSSLLLGVFVILFITYQLIKANKKLILLLFLFGGSFLIFGVGLLNTFYNDRQINIFNVKTKNLYIDDIKLGSYLLKYNTTINDSYTSGLIGYESTHYKNEFSVNCNSAVDCLYKYIKIDPFGFIVLQFIHIFSIFDKTYMDIYIRNVFNENLLIQIYNYSIMSSSLLFFIFFIKKNIDKLIFTIIIFLTGTMLVYVPVGLDPRFSSSIFPLLTATTSIYIYSIFKYKKLNLLFLNVIFMVNFFIISKLILLQMNIGGIWIFK